MRQCRIVFSLGMVRGSEASIWVSEDRFWFSQDRIWVSKIRICVSKGLDKGLRFFLPKKKN